MPQQALTGSSWPGRMLFLVMVAAAGGITWFGMGMRDSLPPAEPAGEVATLAMLPEQPSPIAQTEQSGVRSGLPTRLVIGAASIDAPVRGVGVVVRDGRPAWETAWAAVGHHIDSSLPGQPGNAVFTGHVSVANRGDVPYFAALDTIQAGDIVEVFSGANVYRYRVDEIRTVEPDEIRVLRSDHRSRLTLITCTHDLRHRLVVGASLVES